MTIEKFVEDLRDAEVLDPVTFEKKKYTFPMNSELRELCIFAKDVGGTVHVTRVKFNDVVNILLINPETNEIDLKIDLTKTPTIIDTRTTVRTVS